MKNTITRFQDFTGNGEERRFAKYVLESEGIFEDGDQSSPLNESEEFIFEAAEPKDMQRIQDIVKKSAGSTAKESQLAETMAKLITKKDKAMRRYEAALQLLGKDHHITNIFAQKAVELGNKVDVVTTSSITAPTANSDIQSKTQPEFIYDSQEAIEAWDLFLSYSSKLRGNNWGTPFANKIAKLPSKTRVYLAIKSLEIVNTTDYKIRHQMLSFDSRSGGPKFYSSYSYPSREYFIKPLLSQFDFGDAKTNKDHKAHVLFKFENEKEEKERKKRDLQQAAAAAYSNYKRPKYMFEPGEEYHVYSTRRSTDPRGGIEFNDPWALYFWNHNMIGQMSDGYWENSRKYEGEWKYWSGLPSKYNPNAKPPADNSMKDLMNPKLVQQYAIQSDSEYTAMGKIMVLNDQKFIPLLRNAYGSLPSLHSVGSIESAQEAADRIGITLEEFLAFLFAPVPSLTEIKKTISNAHTEIANAMKRMTHGEVGQYSGKSNY
jgi:hypothetical protein